MYTKWIFFLLLLPKFTFSKEIAVTNNLLCEHSVCDCIFFESGKIEYHCPPSEYSERKISIQVFPGWKKMQINCENVKNLKKTDFPKVKFPKISSLTMQECPIPTDGFREITENFEFSNSLECLVFKNFYSINNLTNENLFENLLNLRKFEFNYGNLTEINGKIFEKIPRLENLTLEDNQLKILDEKIFEYVPNLRNLFLSSNKIEKIPESLGNLSKLERLELWDNNLEKLGKLLKNPNLNSLELSMNKIRKIDNFTFENLPNLEILSLKRNNLSEFSRNYFGKNSKLRRIRLEENHGIKLIDNVFSNLPNLEILKLSSNNLEKLPQNLFENSSNLKELYLDRNSLNESPKNIFENFEKLQELHLEFNNFHEFPSNIFENLSELKILNLEHNNLENLHEKLFENLENLRKLNLGFNKLKMIHPQLFLKTKNLKFLNIKRNLINFEISARGEVKTPFSNYLCTNLEEVDLSFNQITNYPYKLNGITNMREIKLEHNRITQIEMMQMWSFNPNGLRINLGFNSISRVDFENFTPPDGKFNPLILNLTNNPIICDCDSLELVNLVQNKNRPITLEFDELKCVENEEWSLENVKLENLKCFYGGNCTKTKECECFYRSYDETVELNCSHENLREIPEFDFPIELENKRIELNLEENYLENFPNGLDAFENVELLNLRGNRIGNLTWLPGNLKELDLRNNFLREADQIFLETLKKNTRIQNVFLGNNSWNCDCSMKNFSRFLKEHVKIVDIMEIKCNSSGKRIVEMSDKDFCPNQTDKIFKIFFPILILILISSILFSFYQIYKQEILIWLYARGLCLWLVKEDELDKEKIYDAFISFSQKDEQFVTEKLISTLENRENSYKLCVHVRDWIPGELITTQIMNSVKYSRRTIVVLSSNFLESVWGILEFKMAYTESMREGRSRVIIIIYGDLKLEELDEELKSYMKMNTYIKWGDPWFWEKLKYALPKSKRKFRNKHENIMRFIDEKFENPKRMCENMEKIGDNDVMVLDPKKLEENSLTFIS